MLLALSVVRRALCAIACCYCNNMNEGLPKAYRGPTEGLHEGLHEGLQYFPRFCAFASGTTREGEKKFYLFN